VKNRRIVFLFCMSRLGAPVGFFRSARQRVVSTKSMSAAQSRGLHICPTRLTKKSRIRFCRKISMVLMSHSDERIRTLFCH
jgi:hypothetical protein